MKKTETKYTKWGNIKYAYHILFHNYPKMRWILVLYIILGVAAPILGNAGAATAVSCISNQKNIMEYILFMAAILLGCGLTKYLKDYISTWNDFYIDNVQNRYFLMCLLHKSLDADYENIESAEQQRQMNKASHAVNVYREGVNAIYSQGPELIMTLIGAILYSLTISFLDIRIFLVIVLMTISGVFWEKRAIKVEENKREEQFRVWGRFYYLQQQTNTLKPAKDIRIYNMSDWFTEGFTRLSKVGLKISITKIKAWFKVNLSDFIFVALRDLVAYAVLIIKVLNSDISLAEFTFCLGMVAGISNMISSIRYSSAEINKASNVLCEYRKMIDYPNRFLREGGLRADDILKEQLPLTIEFRNVSFRYSEAEEDTIKNLNITINAGEKIALVGHNGAGKTTLVKLLCGLYHPTEGEILVAGHPIEEYNIEEYYKLFSTIFQEADTLPLSIACNISCQKSENTDLDKVHRCILLANLEKDINKLKKKEETVISQMFDEEGIDLSGGQLQRLMLARALYKDAPILILDEPTAALDPLAESNMYMEYEHITEKKTSIFISHRLASTKFCDRILYMENGEIIEEGTHDELLHAGGKYAEVFGVQSKYYV